MTIETRNSTTTSTSTTCVVDLLVSDSEGILYPLEVRVTDNFDHNSNSNSVDAEILDEEDLGFQLTDKDRKSIIDAATTKAAESGF